MKRFSSALLALCLVVPLAHVANASEETRSGSTYATVTDDSIVVGNDLFERRWARSGFGTTTFFDKRVAGGVSVTEGPDFSLRLGSVSIPSTLFEATSVETVPIAGGLRVRIELTAAAISATRIVDIYDGIAGMRERTVLHPLGPLAYGGADLSSVAVGPDVTATIHAFRAGADWRDPDWGGADLAIGDKHPGTWRESTTGSPGGAVGGNAEWISTASGSHSLFMVMERNDFPSSRASYDGDTASLTVDLSRDVIGFGPFEESIHAENPTPAPGRHRVLVPGRPFELEPTFVGFGSGDGDEPWQFFRYLSEHRQQPYDRSVTFNSNGTEEGVLSPGAKDDMNFAAVQQAAPAARRLGIETFILDDGWQARSGDWFPDCPDHPEPRWDGDPASVFAPRFPDCDFSAVREEIAPMELGLWMSPMHFHPSSANYQRHPEWACAPVGDAVAAPSLFLDDGSWDAGLGTWGPDAIDPVVEPTIRRAIDEWGVTYFKFDFLVWLECAGQGDLYDYHDAFVAMVDRLQADYPDVTFQIDETNDYRMFPFESIARGPAWFQNGSPTYSQLLHNLWNLSPYVPSYYIGQHFLGNRTELNSIPIETLMAAAMPSHLTFFSDIREKTTKGNLGTSPAVIDAAAPWVQFYRANRDLLGGMTYPLLADPIEGGWTALQPWDPEEGRGALLAFRQGSEDATKKIPLENVPAGMTFDLIEAPSGENFGTATSQQLTEGLEITLPQKHTARVLLIVPASPDEFDPTTSITYDGDTTARVGDTVTLIATLTGADGPIANAPISFTFRGEVHEASTDGSGSATVTLRAPGPPGIYEVIAAYAGDERYRPSETRSLIELRAGR